MPPYASFGMTTWSPGAQRAQQAVLGGEAGGEGEARARPPSSAARFSSSAVRVGLALRLYS